VNSDDNGRPRTQALVNRGRQTPRRQLAGFAIRRCASQQSRRYWPALGVHGCSTHPHAHSAGRERSYSKRSRPLLARGSRSCAGSAWLARRRGGPVRGQGNSASAYVSGGSGGKGCGDGGSGRGGCPGPGTGPGSGRGSGSVGCCAHSSRIRMPFLSFSQGSRSSRQREIRQASPVRQR
jgi:hypothetical protein